jgi:hypothetical protein
MAMKNKKVSIICDSYKLDKFKEQLTKSEFEFDVKNGIKKDTSIISIKCEESDYPAIKNICTHVEYFFKRSN